MLGTRKHEQAEVLCTHFHPQVWVIEDLGNQKEKKKVGLFSAVFRCTDMSVTLTNTTVLYLLAVGNSRSAKDFQKSVVFWVFFVQKTLIIIWNLV